MSISSPVYGDGIEPLKDGRWVFCFFKNGRRHSSFHSYATREEAKAALRNFVR